jgi:hypothetical protein
MEYVPANGKAAQAMDAGMDFGTAKPQTRAKENRSSRLILT